MPQPGQRPRPRIDSLTDLVFGLVLSIVAIYGILTLFTHILPSEERKLVAPDLLKKYKLGRNLEIVVAIIFLVSAIPQVWVLNVRYTIWASTFFVYRGGSLVRELRKRRYSS